MIPASRSGWRSPVWSAIAPPWEKPATTIRAAENPRAFSPAISASIRACDARIPAASSLPSPTTSYQARITYPRLIVTGRIGAWGKTNRRASVSGSSSSATIGSKSWPSAPSPCIQMTDAAGRGPVSISTASDEIETGPRPAASVIWMHGLGADGHDFEPIVAELELPATLALRFVFPHAPMRPVTINRGSVMRAWYGVVGDGSEDTAGLRASQARVEALIAREKARGFPAARVVLAGFTRAISA